MTRRMQACRLVAPGEFEVQIVRATTAATVVAVDHAEDRLALARELGAHHTIAATDDAASVARAAVGGAVDVVLDFVGETATLDLAAASVAPGGIVVATGMGRGELGFVAGVGSRLPHEVDLVLSMYGSMQDLRDVIALAAGGAIAARLTTYPLADLAVAYPALVAGEVVGRAVIVPG